MEGECRNTGLVLYAVHTAERIYCEEEACKYVALQVETSAPLVTCSVAR